VFGVSVCAWVYVYVIFAFHFFFCFVIISFERSIIIRRHDVYLTVTAVISVISFLSLLLHNTAYKVISISIHFPQTSTVMVKRLGVKQLNI